MALNSPLTDEYDCSTNVVFLAAHANKISLPYWIWERIAERPYEEKSVDSIRGDILGLLNSYIGNPRQGDESKANLRS